MRQNYKLLSRGIIIKNSKKGNKHNFIVNKEPINNQVKPCKANGHLMYLLDFNLRTICITSPNRFLF